MSIKFKCNLCGYEKLISQNTIYNMFINGFHCQIFVILNLKELS